jgi:hypothetical protein
LTNVDFIKTEFRWVDYTKKGIICQATERRNHKKIGVALQESLYFACHSELEPDSSLFQLESRWSTPYLIRGGNDGLRNNVCRQFITRQADFSKEEVRLDFRSYFMVRSLAGGM